MRNYVAHAIIVRALVIYIIKLEIRKFFRVRGNRSDSGGEVGFWLGIVWVGYETLVS